MNNTELKKELSNIPTYELIEEILLPIMENRVCNDDMERLLDNRNCDEESIALYVLLKQMI